MTDAPPPEGPRRVREVPLEQPPALVHPGWADAFPWLIQGTTVRGTAEVPFDLGMFSSGSPESVVLGHWTVLRRALGAECVIHAQQVHGADVRVQGPSESGGGRGAGSWTRNDTSGLRLAEPCDGHATAQPGALLAVTVADCVPVFLVDARRRAVAMLHAGWRGAAAGVLERGFAVMTEAFTSDPSDVHVHFGPAICGDCYEVGPEVFNALDQPVPQAARPIDLRSVLARRATDAGARADHVSVSEHCTRCTESGLFSHRAGDACRQVGYLAVRS